MKKIDKQIEEYLHYCEHVRRMSPVTIRTKRYVLRRFVATTELDDLRELSNEMFDGFVEMELKSGVSCCSVNAYSAVVVAMVRFYIESGMRIPLKISMIKKLNGERTERKFYMAEEIERVLLVCDFETGLMIRLMFETGMRIAELVRLRVFDFEGRRLSFVGKGRRLREAYVSKETFDSLSEYIGKNCVKDFLWGSRTLNGEPPTVATIRKRLKKAFLEAGFEGFYPHALRHSFATKLQMRGASVEEIKEMIGHSSIATTERYLHGFEGKLEELFERYG
ncbi:MAG: site-specific integrase [Candidatus Saccharibacteria bacterium]|nr:site-specific integrase [Candidatus Saccharibacteria bacterium]